MQGEAAGLAQVLLPGGTRQAWEGSGSLSTKLAQVFVLGCIRNGRERLEKQIQGEHGQEMPLLLGCSIGAHQAA